MSRFLGDNDIECWMCEGIGVNQDTDETCWMCEGIGSVDLKVYDVRELRDPPEPLLNKYTDAIWSPLLCAEDTIERITGHDDQTH